jgi:hypothetical protein
MKRVLKSGGHFLIDYLNSTFLVRHMVPLTERLDEPTGLRIIEKRVIDNDFIVKEIEVKPPADKKGAVGASRYYQERVRLIGLAQFMRMLVEAGLVLDNVYGDYDGSPYGADSSKRLILLGRRA